MQKIVLAARVDLEGQTQTVRIFNDLFFEIDSQFVGAGFEALSKISSTFLP